MMHGSELMLFLSNAYSRLVSAYFVERALYLWYYDSA